MSRLMLPKRIGPYEIMAELARGGMATVYLAQDVRVRRPVALKVLPREFLHNPAFRRRFAREVRVAAALEHPAIVPVYDYGEADGQPYLAMRFLAGGSLADRLRNRTYTLGEAAALLDRLAPALDTAHARGLVHRDLKPGNILFDQNNLAYLSDFGLVRLAESAGTRSSGVLGTPAYMSPEQARGDPLLDGRSDLYALGVVLFEMLTGQTPYTAATPIGLAVKHVTEPVPRIRDSWPTLPPACDALIARALAKDPAGRFQSAAEFADSVNRAAARPVSRQVNDAAPTVPLPAAWPSWPPRPRRPLTAWVAAGLLAAGLTAGGMTAAWNLVAPRLVATPRPAPAVVAPRGTFVLVTLPPSRTPIPTAGTVRPARATASATPSSRALTAIGGGPATPGSPPAVWARPSLPTSVTDPPGAASTPETETPTEPAATPTIPSPTEPSATATVLRPTEPTATTPPTATFTPTTTPTATTAAPPTATRTTTPTATRPATPTATRTAPPTPSPSASPPPVATASPPPSPSVTRTDATPPVLSGFKAQPRTVQTGECRVRFAATIADAGGVLRASLAWESYDAASAAAGQGTEAMARGAGNTWTATFMVTVPAGGHLDWSVNTVDNFGYAAAAPSGVRVDSRGGACP